MKALLGLSLSCWHHKPMLDDVMILERYIEMVLTRIGKCRHQASCLDTRVCCCVVLNAHGCAESFRKLVFGLLMGLIYKEGAGVYPRICQQLL